MNLRSLSLALSLTSFFNPVPLSEIVRSSGDNLGEIVALIGFLIYIHTFLPWQDVVSAIIVD